jgi:hypothetical protein
MNNIRDKLQKFLDYKLPDKEPKVKYIRFSKWAKKLEFIYFYIDKNGDVFQIDEKDSAFGIKLMKANAFRKIQKENVYTLVDFVMRKQDTKVIQGFICDEHVDMTFWIKGCQEDINVAITGA